MKARGVRFVQGVENITLENTVDVKHECGFWLSILIVNLISDNATPKVVS